MNARTTALVALAAVTTLIASFFLFLSPAEASTAAPDPNISGTMWWVYASAAVATCVSTIAAAFAVAKVGSAAVASVTEKPELFGRMIVLVGLAEGIAIYGLIVSILILNKVT